MADIFLSYARADVAKIDRLATVLEGLGWTVWWDTDLTAGDNWSDTIELQLQQARCVVVLWSKISVQRPWVLKEATVGLSRERLVPMLLDQGLELPTGFAQWQASSLGTWDGTPWHPELQRLVRDLHKHLGDPPKPVPAHPPYPLYARDSLGKECPASVAKLALPQRAQYFPSPARWLNEVLYLLIPDRFSDGREHPNQVIKPDSLRTGELARGGAVPIERWAASGQQRWQGGTLAGVTSKLGYLQGLGVTTIWLWPVLKQRVAGDTFHGFAPQDFLDVDPHLGTRLDLVELVAQAHHRNMRVILSGEMHHSGENWRYAEGQSTGYTSGRHAFGAWLDAEERLVHEPAGRDDGVWPVELQDPDCYVRAGSGALGPQGEDEENPDAEFRRSDFFSLRTFDQARTLGILVACHRYWLALTDCDGFFLDLVVHQTQEMMNRFCGAIREYAARLGKEDFLVLGEVFGSMRTIESRYSRIGRTLHGSLGAVLDNGPMRLKLAEVAKGVAPGTEWFAGYGDGAGELGVHRALGARHVSILDDPDSVFGDKLRFAFAATEDQIVVALAIQLLSLGIPCIYYGTEQALGQRPVHGGELPQGWGLHDAFLREAMFGPGHPRRAGRAGLEQGNAALDTGLPGFGPFGTAGYHAFHETRPLYQKIAGLIAVRRNHAALRTGRQYQRQVSIVGSPFAYPPAGELVAWSRILDDEEVVSVVNPNAWSTRGGKVGVDSTLNPEGGALQVVFATGAAQLAAAGAYCAGTTVPVLREEGTAYLDLIGIPPGGVVVLSNRPD